MKSRQINKSKRHSVRCSNNNSCSYCRASRTYSNEHRAPVEEKNVSVYEDDNELMCDGGETSHDGMIVCLCWQEWETDEEVVDYLYKQNVPRPTVKIPLKKKVA